MGSRNKEPRFLLLFPRSSSNWKTEFLLIIEATPEPCLLEPSLLVRFFILFGITLEVLVGYVSFNFERQVTILFSLLKT